MNNSRRKALQEIHSVLENLSEQLECLRDEEGEAYENLPEGLKESERGYAMSEALENLESATTSMEELMDYIDSAAE